MEIDPYNIWDSPDEDPATALARDNTMAAYAAQQRRNTLQSFIRSEILTKSQLQQLAIGLVEAVEAGEDSALRTYAQLRQLATLATQVADNIKGHALDEFERRGSVLPNVVFRAQNAPAKWVYPKWSKLEEAEAELERAKKHVKDLQESLKTLAGELVDPDTGEVVPPAEKQEGATGLVTTFAA